MRILVLSQTGDFLGVAQRLRLEGHDVAMWIKEKAYARSGKGIVERVLSWRPLLRWADLVIVDIVGMGKYYPLLKSMGKPFLGCHPEMDRLELDRAYGMKCFADAGITVPETFPFPTPAKALQWMRDEDWGDGFAVKADDNIGCASSRVLTEPEQLDWALEALPATSSLIVQRLVKGVEVSTEGWFDGNDFIPPYNHTFEEKKFLEGNLGPNTGCMGNIVIARESNRLTRATVERLRPLLRHLHWRGPIDVNCIVNEEGAFALEATARFGYDAIEAFLEGVKMGAGEFLRGIASRELTTIPISSDYLIAVRLSVPPYPLEDENVVPEWGEPLLGINEESIRHLWLCNVYVDPKDQLFKTSGADGLTLVATARGESVADARRRVYRTLNNIRVGSKMYRRDIGSRADEAIKHLTDWKWL